MENTTKLIMLENTTKLIMFMLCYAEYAYFQLSAYIFKKNKKTTGHASITGKSSVRALNLSI